MSGPAIEHAARPGAAPSAANAAVGIIGGTFDPVHFGHLRLAEEAADQLGLSEVRLIPTGQPWHRSAPAAGAEHRLAMVTLAAADNPLLRVDATEATSAAPGYSVETLTRLRDELGPERPLVFILGADAFTLLHTWKRWQDLFALVHIGLASRAGLVPRASELVPALAAEFEARLVGGAKTPPQGPAGSIVPVQMSALEISASRIRHDLAAGRSVRYLLPDSVLGYIRSWGLYG